MKKFISMMRQLLRAFARTLPVCGLVIATLVWALPALAEDTDLAQQLQNPVANLISVPFQFNYDWNVGPARDGERLTINVQPVIPFDIGNGWLLVSRTIVPIVYQNDIFPLAPPLTGSSGDQFGLSDTLQSFFFVPPTVAIAGGQFIFGAGPVLQLPTGTETLLSSEKWAAGPTVVGLFQKDGFTVGALFNHVWSFAGDGGRSEISRTFLQPFASYTTPTAWTFGVSADMTYDWKIHDWLIPVGASVSKLVQFGSQPVSLGAKARYYAATTTAGPHGWAVQATVTLLFPTK